MYIFELVILTIKITSLLCFIPLQKLEEATLIANKVFDFYDLLYEQCMETSMSHQRFLEDKLHSYVNAFSKTTVGYAAQFTANRKFFANMISTPAFKEILEKDVNVLHKNILEKMKFCDESVIDQEILKQFYDREVDQTKI